MERADRLSKRHVRSQADPAVTYHLTPHAVWFRSSDAESYLPETFEEEGFVHCTDDPEELIAVGNRYYAADRRPYVALKIRVASLSAPVIYEDPSRQYPHVYGAIARSAIVAVYPVIRGEDGRFVALQRE